jgi:hypothetical protein
MTKPRTHFEQVPLEIVKKIAEEEIPPETTTEPAPITRKKKSEKDRLEAQAPARVAFGTPSQTEVSE